jgi:type II pantothenate kinase
LAKLVYFSREPGSADGGRLSFLNFETDRIDLCIDFIRELKQNQPRLNGAPAAQLSVMATGGGAYKFYERMRDTLHVKVVREDEMACLIMGLDFFITEIPREVFSYSEEEPMQFVEARADVYPYMLVNIGSGVSMIKVSGPNEHTRIGGTHIGGGTFWGLMSLLTGARTFDEMLSMAEKGDNAGVDLLVGDIYGTGYSKIGLKSTAIASTFGKVFTKKRAAERSAEDGQGLSNGDADDFDDGQTISGFKKEDIAKSLLFATSNNIGQLAYLQSVKHEIQDIYFGGSFIQGHPQTMNTLSYAIRFWSNGQKRALFTRHDGYLGAIGCFLKAQKPGWGRRNSLDSLSRTMSKE